MIYDRRRELLSYVGTVRARQPGRSMRCDQIDAALGSDGEIDRMACSGKARIRDLDAGQTIQGDRADYDVGREEVRVSGERVALKDREGKQVEGPELIYDFATGTARIVSRGVFDSGPPAGSDG